MPSVLLVDDSAVARRAVSRRLFAEGFEVLEASSAADARANRLSPFVCAIIDVELLDGDGPSLAAELRTSRASLPIAFFTAGASQWLLSQSQAHGPVFSKPDVDSLVAWVRALSPASSPASPASPAPQPPPTK